MLVCFREGRSNAHIKGDYQRIGDVMLKNFQGLKVRHCSYISGITVVKTWSFMRAACIQTWSLAPDDEPAQAV